MRASPSAKVMGSRAAGWRRWFSASLMLGSLGSLGAMAVSLAACALAGDAEPAAEGTADLTSTTIGVDGITRGADGGDLYAGLEDLHDAALKSALFAIVKNQRALGYNRARQTMFRLPLLVPGAPLECIYTGRVVEPDGTTTPGGFNTEHSWPQSQGADSEPARSDLHHLFPVDERANGARGSFPFGDITCLDGADGSDGGACSFANGGSGLGRTPSGRTAFEVRRKTRGNIARAQFYFSVRYRKAITPEVETTLRAWHDEDPVDDEERTRNDSIDRAQHNRNPFVDRPEFVRQIADF